MEIKTFIEELKKCKASQVMTGQEALSLIVNHEHTRFEISKKIHEKICPHCHTDFSKAGIHNDFIVVIFNSPQENLTIFEAGMLFMVFKEYKKPYDYAKYHECIAGKRFIENIKEIN